MNDQTPNHPALLPAGLRDVLPPDAEIEAKLSETIMDQFAAHGYQRVKPPLLEFEDSLFAGSGAAIIEQTFRLMDPESQRMMGLRADTTPQIARLAATRLGHAPRPLRLAYAGQCLRVRGTQLQPERQIAQAGIELIGNDTAQADAEIILTGLAALRATGITDISVDLTAPRLSLHLLDDLPPEPQRALAHALARKDAADVALLGGKYADLFKQLLESTGVAQQVMPTLDAIALPGGAKAQATRLVQIVAVLREAAPDLLVTVDPVEFRGYRYHTGICMTLFAAGQQAELGRGGRYLSGDTEPATGLTLYPDTIARLAPAPALRPRIYMPFGTAGHIIDQLRAQNYATVMGLSRDENTQLMAKHLGCGFVFLEGDVKKI